MRKPLKVAPWVVPEDLQAIYDYHKLYSLAKAERIVEEYDRVIALKFGRRNGGLAEMAKQRVKS